MTASGKCEAYLQVKCLIEYAKTLPGASLMCEYAEPKK